MLAILHSIPHLIEIIHKNKNITNVYFFTDSKGTLGAFNQCTSFSGLKYIQLILSFFHSSLLQFPHVSFSVKWVPAHYGIQGNELTDENAHIGALFPNPPSRLINSRDIQIEWFHIAAHALSRLSRTLQFSLLLIFILSSNFILHFPMIILQKDAYLFHFFQAVVLMAFFFKDA
jgi:hypothetical protein